MQNYRSGDKICLFGYSRGAYTARALAGMIYKVGLLPPDNAEQLDFAYSVYEEIDEAGSRLGSNLKGHFRLDTVSSIGIIPQSLPYSTHNDGVRSTRSFRPSVWGEPIAVREELNDEPFVEGRGETSRDDWVYRSPIHTRCHSDIGGGSPPEDEEEPRAGLSNIPLRWMIKECFSHHHKFNDEDPPSTPIGDDDIASYVGITPHRHGIGTLDPIWWLPELLRWLMRQEVSMRNFGLGRYIAHVDGSVLVHRTVRDRMDHCRDYKPFACNWDNLIN
ncbi:hypothetical protein BD779DRAFT_1534124 [Infundibulicybe gibba]|nr:hypothetical protein BD779DRAFT_1534124 [Infundibulicybe gibba]